MESDDEFDYEEFEEDYRQDILRKVRKLIRERFTRQQIDNYLAGLWGKSMYEIEELNEFIQLKNSRRLPTTELDEALKIESIKVKVIQEMQAYVDNVVPKMRVQVHVQKPPSQFEEYLEPFDEDDFDQSIAEIYEDIFDEYLDEDKAIHELWKWLHEYVQELMDIIEIVKQEDIDHAEKHQIILNVNAHLEAALRKISLIPKEISNI